MICGKLARAGRVDFPVKLATVKRVLSAGISFGTRARRRYGVVAILAVDQTREVVHFALRKLTCP
jgi:hypothetical protein